VHYIKLGHSGLDVSPIAIGAMTYGEPGRGHPVWSLDEEASRPLIKHALEAGINFFDTANLYSLGSSEEILGRAIRHCANRDDVVITTKIRHTVRPGPNGKGLSRKAIMTEIDHSLRRLGTDYVDIYMIHRLDNDTPLEETLEALHDVVKAGKARYLGASSMRAFEFAKALHLQQANGWARFITMQNHYNLLAREEEHEMLPLCADEGVTTMIWSPLARGRLARPWQEQTTRSAADAYADLLYTDLTADSDRAIVEAVARSPRPGASPGPRSPWPGCGTTPSWPPRWSVRARRPRSTTRPPRSTSSSPTTNAASSRARTPRATTSRASPTTPNWSASRPASPVSAPRPEVAAGTSGPSASSWAPDAWCAKPIGQAVATINTDSPENIAQLIDEHEAGR
jgi:aryl-alcohol dehydrogenase-like predicted oxidoreductase